MQYEASKGRRIKRYGFGVFVEIDWNNPSECFYSWVDDLKMFVKRSEIPRGTHYCSHAPCKTIRRFRKIAKDHPHLKGRLHFESRYRGHDVIA